MQFQELFNRKGRGPYILILVLMITLIIMTIIISHLKMQQLGPAIPVTGGMIDLFQKVHFIFLYSTTI